jgi:alkanesulfonate monooxygenase SsuD/methylene tetrahydromethanopterin reductase-like flavin-dependent oxidoreductase (luciferase family)
MHQPPIRLGIALWPQATTWPELLATAHLLDRQGYDHIWSWDHLYAIYGDPHQPIYEGWTLLAAYATTTEHLRLGLLVGANPFRNPGLVAKTVATLDHVSGGRAILGMGAAWFEQEHRAHGIDFGSGVGERLDWLDEAVGIMRRLLDGEEVTQDSPRYRTDQLRHAPLPLQPHLPIMIGGSGERKTLRTVARYADMWNAMGDADFLRHKDEVLRRHCADVGRDESEIERTISCKLVIRDDPKEAWRVWESQAAHNKFDPASEEDLWFGTPQQIADEMHARVEVGFRTLIVELPPPFDQETIERLIGEVKPMLEG